MEGQGGNQADDVIRKSQAQCHQIRVANRQQLRQTIAHSGHRFDGALVPEAIQQYVQA